MKQLRQLPGSLCCHGISPGPEGHQKLIVLVKGHITMHHSGKSHGTYGMQCYIVFSLHIFFQGPEAGFKSCLRIFQMISPYSLFKPVFPVIAALGNRAVFSVYQHCLYSGRTEFDSQSRISLFYLISYLFRIHMLHPICTLGRKPGTPCNPGIPCPFRMHSNMPDGIFSPLPRCACTPVFSAWSRA